MVYTSISARILLNIEALNMTESAGNYVKHRRAPVVIPTSNGYILRYVPVISGESIAHAYQEILAKIAEETGLPVCSLCRQGVFLKHTDKNVFKRTGIPAPDFKKPESVEETIVKHCVVEDVGGFLNTDAALKRTSRFYAGYMIPALDSIKTSAAEAQFHVRYDPLSIQTQAIYNIEAGSALYVLTLGLDIDGIGVSSIALENSKPKPLVSPEERSKRIEAAFKAMHLLVTQMLFGAKRTRFMPNWKIMSLAILTTHPLPLNVRPAHTSKYIEETIESVNHAVELLGKGASKIEEKALLAYYSAEEKPVVGESSVSIYEARTPDEAFNKSYEYIQELLGMK